MFHYTAINFIRSKTRRPALKGTYCIVGGVIGRYAAVNWVPNINFVAKTVLLNMYKKYSKIEITARLQNIFSFVIFFFLTVWSLMFCRNPVCSQITVLHCMDHV